MKSEYADLFSPLGAKTRRVSAFVAAVAVVTALVFAGSATVQTQQAGAWAWKDTCTQFIFNKTGQQGSLRPILYTPVVPSPASMAQYAAFVAIGVPTQGAGMVLTNTGIPVTWGCHTFLNFANPGPSVHCEVSAPTKGANTFSCGGNSTVKIIKDDDDIAGNVFIPSGSGAGSPQLTPPQPKAGPAALKKTELPGSGWRGVDRTTDLGLFGKLIDEGDLSKSCSAGGGPGEVASSPNTVSTGLFSRRGGAEWVGSAATVFNSAKHAKSTLSEALSNKSLKCLKDLLTSKKSKSTASAVPLLLDGVNDNVQTARVAVRQKVGKGSRTTYVDLIGATKGSKMAFSMLSRTGGEPSEAQQLATVRAALKRVGG